VRSGDSAAFRHLALLWSKPGSAVGLPASLSLEGRAERLAGSLSNVGRVFEACTFRLPVSPTWATLIELAPKPCGGWRVKTTRTLALLKFGVVWREPGDTLDKVAPRTREQAFTDGLPSR
jgi:hypothetical protein